MKGIDVTPSKVKSNNSFPIVAIGASAGGMEAIKELLQHLPESTGMSYIYIQHMSPEWESQLPSILGRETKMPVTVAKDKLRIKPNHLYVIPPDRDMEIVDGELKLLLRPVRPQMHLPINLFFTSLASNYKEKAIGILLSGNLNDGTQGLKAIKAEGGITFAQDHTARFQGMPKNAVTEEVVDLILPPNLIAEELSKLSRQQESYHLALADLNKEVISDRDENLLSIIRMLHRLTGADFSHYKPNTIKRRIIRRMILNKIETLSDYSKHLKHNTSELHQLYQDLLINVTNFFRDANAMEYLKKELIAKLVQSKAPSEPVRIWVPACSTGQEAYSLAMLMIEVLGEKAATTTVQIFATDLSETAINKARIGIYSKDEVVDVSPKRLQQFFNKIDGSHRIIKFIRDLCVFAKHNVLKDPPFSRLDLISCCNLMIYLEPLLQKKILGTFHYVLNSNGYLMLGESETVSSAGTLFHQIDKKHKIYFKKKDVAAKAMFEMTFRGNENNRINSTMAKTALVKIGSDDLDMDKAVDELLLKKFTPACVVVNSDLEIVQFRGSTGLFLEPSPGKASLNLMKMARSGLAFELRNIVHKATKSGEIETKSWSEIDTEEKSHKISISALPLKKSTPTLENYYLIIFEQTLEDVKGLKTNTTKDRKVKQLEEELTVLREDMRSMVESFEAANEELQSVNEEIVSSNEELQSINEEMETSKEELESSNEELLTINQELQMRNEQLAEVQEYSEAIFTTIRESLLILDKNLRIKNANSCFYKTFKVTEEETENKLLYDLGNGQWNIPKLKELLEEIIPRNAHVTEFEVAHTFPGIGEKVMLVNARRLIRKLNSEHLILMAMEDVTEHRKSLRIIAEREAWFRNTADNAPMMIWVTDLKQRNQFVNKAWLEFRNIDFEQAIGKHWIEDDIHPDDLKPCKKIFEKSFDQEKPFTIQYRLKKGEDHVLMLSKGKPNYNPEGAFTGFIGTCVELPPQIEPEGEKGK